MLPSWHLSHFHILHSARENVDQHHWIFGWSCSVFINALCCTLAPQPKSFMSATAQRGGSSAFSLLFLGTRWINKWDFILFCFKDGFSGRHDDSPTQNSPHHSPQRRAWWIKCLLGNILKKTIVMARSLHAHTHWYRYNIGDAEHVSKVTNCLPGCLKCFPWTQMIFKDVCSVPKSHCRAPCQDFGTSTVGDALSHPFIARCTATPDCCCLPLPGPLWLWL